MEEISIRPRVLVTTVGAWSNDVGSDTMSSLMQQYGAENVAALYIRADLSDSTSACRYFHIIERRVMISIFKRKLKTGEEFQPGDVKQEEHVSDINAEHSQYRFFKQHRWGIFLLVRELIWKFGKWKTPELDEFLDDFHPDVLVCPLESYIHFNRINKYVIKKCTPRVIGFLWDDNFTYKQKHNFWHQLHRFFLRKSIRQLIKQCDTVFALSPKMKEECDKEFGIQSHVLTKPIFNQGEFASYTPGKTIRMLYAGNLFVGRDKTMIAIAEALRIINRDSIKITLDIYTKSQLPEKVLKQINIDGICMTHPPIPQDKIRKLQSEVDVLLFAESLAQKKNQEARLSFSTKITDYFSAGRCILAIGSPTLSAMDYLKRYDTAIICNTREDILPMLQKITGNKKIIIHYARKAYDRGKENHNADVIFGTLYHAISKKY